jgi:hypothetical protein
LLFLRKKQSGYAFTSRSLGVVIKREIQDSRQTHSTQIPQSKVKTRSFNKGSIVKPNQTTIHYPKQKDE